MSNRRLEALAWMLIYAGLLGAVFGLALRATHGEAGWTLIAAGVAVAAAGAVLVWVRSRRADPKPGAAVDSRSKP